MKKIVFILASLLVLSCSKSEDENPATKELTVNYENLKGKWVFTSKINADGSTVPCINYCSTQKDHALIWFNYGYEILANFSSSSCSQNPVGGSCLNFYFDGKRIKNCNEYFENAVVTSLTATTLKIEYDSPRIFSFGGNQDAKGFIFTKE